MGGGLEDEVIEEGAVVKMWREGSSECWLWGEDGVSVKERWEGV